MTTLPSRPNSNPQPCPGTSALSHGRQERSERHCPHPETVCRAVMSLWGTSLSHQLKSMGFKSQRRIWFIIFCSNPLELLANWLQESFAGIHSHMWKSLLVLCPDPHTQQNNCPATLALGQQHKAEGLARQKGYCVVILPSHPNSKEQVSITVRTRCQ